MSLDSMTTSSPFVMKTRNSLTAALVTCLAAHPAHAIQPPADDAPPPPPLAAGETMPKPPNRPAEDEPQAREMPAHPEPGSGYLGLSVAPIPELLGAHLEVPENEGVLVRIVAPGSPAANAGIQVHDVLLEVDGRAITSHDDLLGIVNEHHAGDTLAVTVLRKGQTIDLKATLVARPDVHPPLEPRMGAFPLAPEDLFFDDLPDDHAARIRGMIEQNLRALRDPGGMFDDEVFQGAFDNMREQMERLLAEPKPFGPLDDRGGIHNLRMNTGTTVRLMDDEGSIELKIADGSKEVTVRDLQNEVLWTGPWDTDQDKASAPDGIRKRVERLNIDGFDQDNGLQLQFFRNR